MTTNTPSRVPHILATAALILAAAAVAMATLRPAPEASPPTSAAECKCDTTKLQAEVAELRAAIRADRTRRAPSPERVGDAAPVPLPEDDEPEGWDDASAVGARLPTLQALMNPRRDVNARQLPNGSVVAESENETLIGQRVVVRGVSADGSEYLARAVIESPR